MNFSPLVTRNLFWLNLPSTVLLVLLQRLPVLKQVSLVGQTVLASPLGAVLRSALVGATSLGAVNTLVGATELESSTPDPASATVGTPVDLFFVFSGTPSRPTSWTVTGLPPGLTFSAAPTSMDILRVQGIPTAAGSFGLTIIARNPNGTAFFSYTIDVESNAVEPPSIATPPANQMVTVGGGFSFSVTANGTPPFSYVWRRQGTPIPNATSNPYTVESATLAHAGDYDVVVTNSAGNATSGVATLTVNKAPAEVSLGNLSATYDGTPKSASATTNPAGLTVTFTYDGSATPPTNAGNYAVIGTVNDVTYQGNSSGSLVINRAPQAITFNPLGNRVYSPTPLALTATSDAGLPVALAVLSGPASVEGNTLTLTGAGLVTVRATQAGNTNFFAAPLVERSFVVSGNFASWQLDHFSGAELTQVNVSGSAADPDADGLNNLLEYALGLNPRTANGAAPTTLVRTETEWIFTYPRPADRADVVCAVEISTTLMAWTKTGVVHELLGTENNVATWRARFPASAANAFFRLEVSRVGEN